MPGWAWVIIVLLVVIAVAAVVVAVAAVRGDGSDTAAPAPAPVTSAPATNSPSATPSSPASSSPADPPADGCLGGATNLNQAVLAAQKAAPLTQSGAAAFTATLVRWSSDTPAPRFQKRTAEQILTSDATSAAGKHLSSTIKDLKGSTLTIDFSTGKYYVEVFTGTSAVVSYLTVGHVTLDGAAAGDVNLAATIHLKAINGVWRWQDDRNERSIADLQRIGIAYSGGC
jgi:hypothetical protein